VQVYALDRACPDLVAVQAALTCLHFINEFVVGVACAAVTQTSSKECGAVMYQAHESTYRNQHGAGQMLSYAGSPDIAAPGRLAHVRQSTILAGILAVDAAMGMGVPLLVARYLSSQPAGWAPIVLLTAVLTLGLIGSCGGYSPALLQLPLRQVRTVLMAGTTAVAVTALAAWVFEGSRMVDPEWALPAIAFGLAGLCGGRGLACWMLARECTRIYVPRTVVVGGGEAGAKLIGRLLAVQRAATRVRLIGYVDDHSAPAIGAAYLGALPELIGLIREGSVDRVILALPRSAQKPMLELIGKLAECPVHIQLARNDELVDVMEPPLPGLAALLKRGEDILLATIALVPCLMLMVGIAVLIKLDSPGPVLFRQRRTGFNNRDFQMLKFRSMHHRREDGNADIQAIRNDPRITRVGVWLRRSSLDELPQIFNVLSGDMSIVGPRPHAPATRAGGRVFDEVVTDYAARHRVRPGVTGLAQVRGLRGPTETEDKLARRVDSDLEYIENWSLWLDMAVLARTALAVLGMKNAC
jgi:Undecaprenyl-phosphate glucose phosphotransferase